MPFNWLDQIPALTNANLTIREQTRLADNPLDLRYRAIFPRVPTSSVKLSSITNVDFRPTGGRREWNAQGREIPEKLGPRRDFEMVPINPTHHIDERTLQLYGESGVDELVRRGVIGDVNTWPARLADAVERQLERDAFEAWSTGAITVMDPKTGTTLTVSLGFDAARYVTEGTAWATVANAYDRFLFHIGEAQRLMGSVGAVRMRRATINEVVKDAPTGANGMRPTITNIRDRVVEEGFPDVSIIIDERTYDAWTDGGSAGAAANYVPTGRVLFQPANGVVGNTHVAPVTRAYDFLSGANRSLAQGVVIFKSEKNDGKTLLIEAQENSLPMPEERYTYVVNAIT